MTSSGNLSSIIQTTTGVQCATTLSYYFIWVGWLPATTNP